MSIERKLTDAFKENEASLEYPSSLDTRIMAEYDRVVMKTGRDSRMKIKWSMPKVAMIVLIVTVLCGFAYSGSKFMFKDSQGNFSIRLQSNESFTLDPAILDKARNSIKEVKAQLEQGETAVVYYPELFLQFPIEFPVIGVSNLQYVYDAEQWKAELLEQGITESLPESLLAGAYIFEAGAINSPFYAMMGLDVIELLDDMKAEKKNNSEDKPLWRITDTATFPEQSVYTSVYRDSNGEHLYFIWKLYHDAIRVESFTSPSTEYEELELDGRKLHYTQNNESLFGESTTLQSMMWIEETGNETIVYSMESDSVNMTKEKLLEAVKSLP